MKYFTREHLPMRLLFAVFMATMSMVMVKVAGDVYFRYFDKTVYYSIEQPISLDKKFYNPCEVTRAMIKRIALVDIAGSSVVDLILMRDDGNQEKVAYLNRLQAMPKGARTIIVDWPLPCDVQEGRYYWQAVVSYQVRGIQKTYSYLTESFNVTNHATQK